MSVHRIVFVGGGSGGHFYPLIAIAEAIQSESNGAGREAPKLYFMGPDPYDQTALDEQGIMYVSCPSGKIRKYFSILNFIDLIKIFSGLFVALWKLFYLYPDVIMSKGGYTSVPVVCAGWLLRIPIVIHESDAVPGSANRFAARFATSIAISYPDTQRAFTQSKTVLTGIPIRKKLLLPIPHEREGAPGIDTARPTILVVGGSQGAERVNALVIESLDELLPTYNIIHQTGAALFEEVSASARALMSDKNLISHYHPAPFFTAEKLHAAMTVASLIISRAGSGSIFEIALHGKPSILIPIPEEVSHDQRTNAYAYARTGAGVVMEERNLRDGLLAAEIARIMGDRALYVSMSEAAKGFVQPYAAEKLASTLMQIAQTH